MQLHNMEKQPLTELELKRLEKIAANKRRLEEIGLYEAKNALEGAPQRKPAAKQPRRPKQRDAQARRR